MDWKFSANAGFFGLRRDRFNEYQPARSLAEQLALVAQLEGVQGVELKDPADFADQNLVREVLGKHNLELSAVNVDTKNVAHFRNGALSAPSGDSRQRAIALLREGMDLAADMRVALVTTCPVMEAYDYPFQMDYFSAWDHLIESVRAVVSHRQDVTLLLEYQPNEPHAHALLGNVGAVLHVFAEVDAPNLGANLDIRHSFAAGEAPAEAAALLARQGRLFYIHTNDNTGNGGDWDMISGSVHFWHWLELLYVLKLAGYAGWMGGDISPKVFSPVDAYRTHRLMVQRRTRLLERIGVKQITELIQQGGNIAQTYQTLSSFLDDAG